MSGRRLAAALMVTSLVLTVWLIVGGYVSYSSHVSASTMQNIYLERINWFGGVIGMLQLAAVLSLIVGK